jgi:tetratricopeptide (TPR) repeat protein
MSPVMTRRALRLSALAVSLALAGCAGPSGNVKLGGPKVGAGGEVEISGRAKLKFEDALKAFEAQKKANTWDYPALEKKFQAALDEDPNLAEAHYNLGVLAERQSKQKEAVAQYEAALKRKPTLKQAAENLAVIRQNQGDVPGALGIYQQILSHYPDDASTRGRLAEIYRQNGDHERAMQFAREALMREPKTLSAYKVMMRSYLDRRQLSMARLVALRAMKIDEADPELYFTVAEILLKEGERQKAMLQYKKAVEVRADYLPSHYVLAKMAMEDQDYSGAEEHLRRILQGGGKSAEAMLNLGVAYKGMGQFDKAMQAYDEAEKLNPELAQVYLNRGIIMHRHKNAPKPAIDLYKKYLAMAGGEVGIRSDAPVFALLREAEDLIRADEEMKRQEEEMKRMEAEMARQEAEMKRMEAEAAKAEGKPGEKKDAAQAQPQPAVANPAAKPAAKPAAAPAPKRSKDEPGDEPEDGL